MAQAGTARWAVPDRGDQGGRSAGRRWPAWSALALLALAFPAAAAEPFNRDARHTLLARRALFADPQLAALNLGVKIDNRVVVVWGAVPTTAHAKRAEHVLRGLPDFVQVRSELHIDGDDIVVTPASVRPGFLPEMAPESARQPLQPKPRDELPVIGQISIAPAAAASEKPTPLCVRRPPPAAGMLTKHFAPLPVAAVPSNPIQMTSAVPEVSGTPPMTLERTVRDLQQSKDAFRQIDVSVRDAVVTVRGPANLPATHELARLIARLPGVERVILRE